MMKNKFLIEVVDDATAIITSVDKDGVKKAKRIHIKKLSDVLNLKSSNFNTGILPSNIVNIYQNGTYRAYHIFVPSYSTKISHTRYSEEPVFVKYPSMLFSFINDMSASNPTTKRSMIRVLDTEEFDINTPLYPLYFNNYSDSYGICWGNNKDVVEEALASYDDFRISTLPKLFLESKFNNDLEYTYDFTREVLEEINATTGSDSRNSFNLFRYMYETNGTYWMSSMIENSYSDQSVRDYISAYNASIL